MGLHFFLFSSNPLIQLFCFSQASFLLDGPLVRPDHGGHQGDRGEDEGGAGDVASEGAGARHEGGVGLRGAELTERPLA